MFGDQEFRTGINNIKSDFAYKALNIILKNPGLDKQYRTTLISWILKDHVACYNFILKCDPTISEKFIMIIEMSRDPHCAYTYFKNFNPTNLDERNILIESISKSSYSIKLIRKHYMILTDIERKTVFKGMLNNFPNLDLMSGVIREVPLNYDEQLTLANIIIKANRADLAEILMDKATNQEIEDQLLSFLTVYKLMR